MECLSDKNLSCSENYTARQNNHVSVTPPPLSNSPSPLNLNTLSQRKQWINELVSQSLDDDQILQLCISSYKPLWIGFNLQNSSTKLHLLWKKDESIYFGEVSQGQNELPCKRNGIGVLCYFNDGRVYEGEWKNNKKHGKGIELFSNGGAYSGGFYENKRSGKGQFKWSNGEVYDGEWLAGMKHGSGLWRGSKGIIKCDFDDVTDGFEGDSYIGEWKNGKTDGFGVHTWINGDRYEGQFKDCLKHGQGAEKFGNGDTYIGSYQFGRPHGQGEYKWQNGSYYKGNFVKGVREGKGFWVSSTKDQYQGEYKNDKKSGYGQYRWSSGTVYTGFFENDLQHGYGEITYPSNDGDQQVVVLRKGYYLNGILVRNTDEKMKENENGNRLDEYEQVDQQKQSQNRLSFVDSQLLQQQQQQQQQQLNTLPFIYQDFVDQQIFQPERAESPRILDRLLSKRPATISQTKNYVSKSTKTPAPLPRSLVPLQSHSKSQNKKYKHKRVDLSLDLIYSQKLLLPSSTKSNNSNISTNKNSCQTRISGTTIHDTLTPNNTILNKMTSRSNNQKPSPRINNPVDHYQNNIMLPFGYNPSPKTKQFKEKRSFSSFNR